MLLTGLSFLLAKISLDPIHVFLIKKFNFIKTRFCVDLTLCDIFSKVKSFRDRYGKTYF